MAGAAVTERILKEVSRVFQQPKETLLCSKRGERNAARLTALSLARELSGLRLTELAEAFQIRSYRTVATACYRFKRLLREDLDIRRRYVKIHQVCSQEKT